MNTQIAQLSPAQVNILNMMSFIKTPRAIDELNEILSNYFSNRLDEEIDKLWADGRKFLPSPVYPFSCV